MAWTVWGYAYADQAEFDSTNVFASFRMNSDTIVQYCRTWFIIFDNPSFVSLTANIYSNRLDGSDNSPGLLLYSSDARLKSEIHTEDYGVRETWFEFTDTIPLQGDTWYNLVISANTYSPSGNAHIAWKHSYPDPVYTTDYTPAVETINKSPFDFYFIGGEY